MATQQNNQTLIATFKDYSTARQVARELESGGIPEDSIRIDSNQKTAGAGSSEMRTGEQRESGFMEWWNSLFGSDHSDDDETRGYQGALQSGSAILRATVPAQQVDMAAEILNRNGARDVDTRTGSESRSGGTSQSASTGAPIQVVEEELKVGKRAVRRGGVRIYSHVITEPVERQINLREEHVNVERRKVDREISPADVSALRDQTIEVTEMDEEPVVSKRARVTEEVVVGKESTDRTETVRDNVRRTEVEVEQLGTEDTSPSKAGKAASSGRKVNMSVAQPEPGTMSGNGTTAGTGTLAGEATAGSALQDFPGSADSASDYGYRYARDPRYKGKSWDQVENDVRRDYESSNPGGNWDQAKAAIRNGWEKVTNG